MTSLGEKMTPGSVSIADLVPQCQGVHNTDPSENLLRVFQVSTWERWQKPSRGTTKSLRAMHASSLLMGLALASDVRWERSIGMICLKPWSVPPQAGTYILTFALASCTVVFVLWPPSDHFSLRSHQLHTVKRPNKKLHAASLKDEFHVAFMPNFRSQFTVSFSSTSVIDVWEPALLFFGQLRELWERPLHGPITSGQLLDLSASKQAWWQMEQRNYGHHESPHECHWLAAGVL